MGFPNSQSNPAGAIPVYVVAYPAGGFSFLNIPANGANQVKDGEGVFASVVTNIGGTTSAIALFDGSSDVVTITIATPGVITWADHPFVAGSLVKFYSTGALPTGLTIGTTYHVIAAGLAANTFRVSATAGGSAINTSGSQSGVHTAYDVTRPIATLDTTTQQNGLAYNAGFDSGLIAITTGGAAADVTVLFA